DQPSEMRDALNHFAIPRDFLTHPDMADHPGHDEYVDRTIAVHGKCDVEAIALRVAKSGIHHRREVSHREDPAADLLARPRPIGHYSRTSRRGEGIARCGRS